MKYESTERTYTNGLDELDQLIQVVSHDLRAPLRAITHLSEWIADETRELLDRELPESLDENFRLLRNRVQRLDRLIGGLVAYSRAGRGIFEEPKGLELGSTPSLLEVCQTLAMGPFDEGAAAVRIVAGTGADKRLANLSALRVVVWHLLANAACHARVGTQAVHVTVSARSLGDTGSHCEVAFADDGLGIDPRHHARVWGLFQTLESRDRCDTAGVGLAIVRRIVERNGGGVGLDSQVGAGSTFRFTWPTVPA